MSDDDLDFLPAAPGGAAPAEGEAKAPSKATPAEPSDDGDHLPGERADLPTWNRARRKRKANVKAQMEDDAFQRGVRKASRQVIDTPKLALGAIVIIVIAVAGGVMLTKRSTQTDAEAARALQTATSTLVRGRVIPEDQREAEGPTRAPVFASEDEQTAAVNEALAAAKATNSELINQDALLVAGAQAMRVGDFETAAAEYQQFLDSADDHHPLRFLALEGQGNALEAKGDYEGALAAFQAIAPRTTDHYRSMALYHQGRVLESLERKDEALAIYQQFFEEFPGEEVATQMVRARVEILDPEFAARLAAPPPSPIPSF